MIPSLQQITPNDRQDKKKNTINTYENYDISFCQKGSKAWVAASNTAKQYNGSLGALVYGFFFFSRAYLAREKVAHQLDSQSPLQKEMFTQMLADGAYQSKIHSN